MVDLVIFEDDSNRMRPFNLTRPSYMLVYGYRTILSQVKRHLSNPESFILPKRFESYYREQGVNVNPDESSLEGDKIYLNGSVRPEKDVLEKIAGMSQNSALISSGRVAALRVSRFSYELLNGMQAIKQKGIEIFEDDVLIKGPWELIAALGRGLEGRGVIYGERVQVEEPVYFDTARGPVLLAEGARIEAFSRIEGPALIGKNTVVHSARINGHTFIGDSCRIGGEVESSIVSSYSNKAHLGYLGHSYVGEWVNIGAGTITSDLKNTYGTVRMIVGEDRVDTGMIKLGSFLGDYSKSAINTSIYSGKKIGSGSHIYGIISNDVPAFVSYDGKDVKELFIDSVIETARRMKRRRGQELSRGEEELIRLSYEEERKERMKVS